MTNIKVPSAVNEDCDSQNDSLNTVGSDTISIASDHEDYFANTIEPDETPYSSEQGGGVSCGGYAHFSRGIRANVADQSASSTTYLNSGSFMNSASTPNAKMLSDYIHDGSVSTSIANHNNPRRHHNTSASSSNVFAGETDNEATPLADLSAITTGVNTYSNIEYDYDGDDDENSLDVSNLNDSQSTEEGDSLNIVVKRDGRHSGRVVDRLVRYHSGSDMSASIDSTLNDDSTLSIVDPVVPTSPYNNDTAVNAPAVNPIGYPPSRYTYPMPTLPYPIPGYAHTAVPTNVSDTSSVTMSKSDISGQTTVPLPSGTSVNYSSSAQDAARGQRSYNLTSQSAIATSNYYHNFYPALRVGAANYVSPMSSMYATDMFPNGGAKPPLVRSTIITSSDTDVPVVEADSYKYNKSEEPAASTIAKCIDVPDYSPVARVREVKTIKKRRFTKTKVTCPTFNKGNNNQSETEEEEEEKLEASKTSENASEAITELCSGSNVNTLNIHRGDRSLNDALNEARMVSLNDSANGNDVSQSASMLSSQADTPPRTPTGYLAPVPPPIRMDGYYPRGMTMDACPRAPIPQRTQMPRYPGDNKNTSGSDKQHNIDHGARAMFRGVTYYPRGPTDQPQMLGNPHIFQRPLSRNTSATSINNRRMGYRGFSHFNANNNIVSYDPASMDDTMNGSNIVYSDTDVQAKRARPRRNTPVKPVISARDRNPCFRGDEKLLRQYDNSMYKSFTNRLVDGITSLVSEPSGQDFLERLRYRDATVTSHFLAPTPLSYLADSRSNRPEELKEKGEELTSQLDLTGNSETDSASEHGDELGGEIKVTPAKYSALVTSDPSFIRSTGHDSDQAPPHYQLPSQSRTQMALTQPQVTVKSTLELSATNEMQAQISVEQLDHLVCSNTKHFYNAENYLVPADDKNADVKNAAYKNADISVNTSAVPTTTTTTTTTTENTATTSFSTSTYKYVPGSTSKSAARSAAKARADCYAYNRMARQMIEDDDSHLRELVVEVTDSDNYEDSVSGQYWSNFMN